MHAVLLTPDAEEFLRKSDKPTRERITKKLEGLQENPRLGKPLAASLAGFWSLRAGDYRAVYTIKGNEILVVSIGHRKNAYTKK